MEEDLKDNVEQMQKEKQNLEWVIKEKLIKSSSYFMEKCIECLSKKFNCLFLVCHYRCLPTSNELTSC